MILLKRIFNSSLGKYFEVATIKVELMIESLRKKDLTRLDSFLVGLSKLR